jgi:GPH family glycoside/pentoside/hexuronide:cation symporter
VLFATAVTGVILGSVSSRPIAALIPEKKTVFSLGLAWYAFFTSLVIILRLLGVLPDNEDPLVPVLYISCSFISAVGLGVALPMIGSMIADITDEHERLYGDRQEGIYYAAASFAGKAVGGAGPVVAGFVIDLAGIAPGSSPESVTAEAIVRFGWVSGPSVIVLSGISIAAISFYRITRERHAETLALIQSGTRSPAS